MKDTLMRPSLLLAAFIAIAAALIGDTASVDAADRPEISIWPNGLPAGAKPVEAKRIEELKRKLTEERIYYVETPTITVYQAPEEKANGCAVVICPGGGYNILAWPKEGLEVAEWFNSIGVTAAVLKYRVPRRDPAAPHVEPLQDAQRALRLVRHYAKDWNVDPQRVGILGFSAGGHLTAMTGMHWKKAAYDRIDEADDLSCRPDFMCPIYAAYLGPDYKDNVAELGPLVDVTAKTPPTFMAVTADDTHRGSLSALLFVQLKLSKVPAELHIYSKGGHGYGIRESANPISTWHHRLGDWLKAQGLLNPPVTKQ
jgi:acetyl esterase/lipase